MLNVLSATDRNEAGGADLRGYSTGQERRPGRILFACTTVYVMDVPEAA